MTNQALHQIEKRTGKQLTLSNLVYLSKLVSEYKPENIETFSKMSIIIT